MAIWETESYGKRLDLLRRHIHRLYDRITDAEMDRFVAGTTPEERDAIVDEAIMRASTGLIPTKPQRVAQQALVRDLRTLKRMWEEAEP